METGEITRRNFLIESSVILMTLAIPFKIQALSNNNHMKDIENFEVIIIGGSYSGLSAGMALGRALRKVLIIDNGKPCNSQTPHSHNFITHDGKAPAEITALAKKQIEQYNTVRFLDGTVIEGQKVQGGFEITVQGGARFKAKKLVFATGIKDMMPDIEGFSECWGISALHCPYCHGYEVRDQKTGILGNGDFGYEFSALISNWTKKLTLYTNGKSTLSAEQFQILKKHDIQVVEKEILKMDHDHGSLKRLVFKDGSEAEVTALYSKRPFIQHSNIPEKLGCELNDEGYIRSNAFYRTTIDGVYACGDNVTRMRTVANAVAMGTTTGMMVNKELVEESFN